ncbi:MAG TPA: mucoidy inhibitor MuiA family protein, partial [Gemmataceae bacterium]
MRKRLCLTLGVAIGLCLGGVALSRLALTRAADPAAPDDQPKAAASKVTAVTVYQNNALITREVEVPEGAGAVEVVVTPLPPQTINSSLYTEGTEEIRVLSTRFRTRPMKEDTREEVRKAEAEMHKLALDAEKLQSDAKTTAENMALLGKLENFTAASTQHATEKGNLNSDSAIALSDHVMKKRTEFAKELVEIQQKLQANAEQVGFVKRQLAELAAGTSKTERDAVIVVDKRNAAPGRIRLNYLVDSAAWKPQYKLRAGKDKDPVRVEYLAAIAQQTGEDWKDVNLTLSTAQPLFNAAPPDLRTLSVGLMPRGGNPMATIGVPNVPGNGQVGNLGNQGGLGGGLGAAGAGAGQSQPGAVTANVNPTARDYQEAAKGLRGQALAASNSSMKSEAEKLINEAAVVEQTYDLLAQKEESFVAKGKPSAGAREGQSVTYHLPSKLTIPSRNDEQVI